MNEAGGDGGNRSALGHHKLRPAVKEAHHRSIGPMHVNVFAARLGKRRSQFCVTQRSEQAEDSGENLDHKHQHGRAELAEHDAGYDENSPADHGPGHNRHGAVDAQPFDEFVPFFHRLLTSLDFNNTPEVSVFGVRQQSYRLSLCVSGALDQRNNALSGERAVGSSVSVRCSRLSVIGVASLCRFSLRFVCANCAVFCSVKARIRANWCAQRA